MDSVSESGEQQQHGYRVWETWNQDREEPSRLQAHPTWCQKLAQVRLTCFSLSPIPFLSLCFCCFTFTIYYQFFFFFFWCSFSLMEKEISHLWQSSPHFRTAKLFIGYSKNHIPTYIFSTTYTSQLINKFNSETLNALPFQTIFITDLNFFCLAITWYILHSFHFYNMIGNYQCALSNNRIVVAQENCLRNAK